MAHLPEWTNNSLIVGLVLALFSTVLAAVQGVIAWYLPIVTGLCFSLLIACIAVRTKLSLLVKKLIQGLPAFGKAVVRVSLLFLALFIAGCFFYGLYLGAKKVLDAKSGTDLFFFIVKYSPWLASILFYVLITILKGLAVRLLYSPLIPKRIPMEEQESVRRSFVNNGGYELCAFSLLSSIILGMIYVKWSIDLNRVVQVLIVTVVIGSNFIVVVISLVLTSLLYLSTFERPLIIGV